MRWIGFSLLFKKILHFSSKISEAKTLKKKYKGQKEKKKIWFKNVTEIGHIVCTSWISFVNISNVRSHSKIIKWKINPQTSNNKQQNHNVPTEHANFRTPCSTSENWRGKCARYWKTETAKPTPEMCQVSCSFVVLTANLSGVPFTPD